MLYTTLTTPAGEQDRLVFCVNTSLFCRHVLAPPTLRVAWRWHPLTIYFWPFSLGLPFLIFVWRTSAASLPCSEAWEWVSRCSNFDLCFSSWNRGFNEFRINIRLRLIRVSRCYGTVLNGVKRAEITLDQVLGSYL